MKEKNAEPEGDESTYRKKRRKSYPDRGASYYKASANEEGSPANSYGWGGICRWSLSKKVEKKAAFKLKSDR